MTRTKELPPDLQYLAEEKAREGQDFNATLARRFPAEAEADARQKQIIRLLAILSKRDNHNREGRTELAALAQEAFDQTMKRLDPITVRAFADYYQGET